MTRSLFALLGVLAVISPSAIASADEPTFAYRLPPALPQTAPEAPPREPDDIPRRRFELALRGGVAALGCNGSAPGALETPDPCADRGVGTTLRIEALWRPIPMLAVGGIASVMRFGWDASRGLAEVASSGPATLTHVGVAARGYFLDTGTIEPWVGASMGVGYLAMKASSSAGDEELWRNSMMLTGSAGVDAWVSGHLRLGIAGGLDFLPGSSVQHCTGDVCLDASSVVARIPDHGFHADVSVTFALGPEL